MCVGCRNEKGEVVRDYTVANRVKEHNEMQQIREEQENKSKPKVRTPFLVCINKHAARERTGHAWSQNKRVTENRLLVEEQLAQNTPRMLLLLSQRCIR